MQELQLSLTILSRILDEKKTFSDALKETFYENVGLRPLRANVAGLVGCEIRHHYLFQTLLKDLPLEEEEKRLATLALANCYFFHRFEDEAVLNYLKENIAEEKIEAISALLVRKQSMENYIPESIARDSLTYLSVRYNCPEWALKIFQHYGAGNCHRLLRSFSRPFSPYVRVREDVLSTEDVLKDPSFAATDIDNLVHYEGKVSLRKCEWVRTGALFAERPIVKKLVEDYLVSDPCEVLLYNGNADTCFEKELIQTYGSSIGLNIGVDNVDTKLDVARLIREKELKNVNFFSVSDPSFLDASVSKKQDVVFVVPESTNFDLVPTTPEYLINYNRDGMTALFEKEKAALEGGAKFVEENGVLVYVIFTVSKKEGRSTIAEFLKTHSEFHLESEKQYFPSDEYHTACYVAALRKGEKTVKIAAPLGDLSALQSPFPASVSSARNK